MSSIPELTQHQRDLLAMGLCPFCERNVKGWKSVTGFCAPEWWATMDDRRNRRSQRTPEVVRVQAGAPVTPSALELALLEARREGLDAAASIARKYGDCNYECNKGIAEKIAEAIAPLDTRIAALKGGVKP